METHISLAELTDLTGLTRRTVRRRANTEKWSSKTIFTKGRPGKKYIISTLPEEIRILYNKVYTENIPALPISTLPVPVMPDQISLSDERTKKGMLRADLLRLYTIHIENSEYGNKTRARKEFMRAYNSGIAYPKLYEAIGSTHWKTIEGWKRLIKAHDGDTMCLAEKRGVKKRGSSRLTEEQEQIVMRCVLHPNKPNLAEAIRMAHAVMSTRGIQNGHSEATYRRWIKDWASRNDHIWTFHREGAKNWNDKCAYYIERDYNLINVGDILVADGHTLNFEILNPWTGKPKRMILILWKDMKSNFPLGWEIMPTEDTQAIASALRRAILRLGKYPKVAYLDNGKAFKSRFFQGVEFNEEGYAGLYERLGIETIFAWPYHGQSKTVERFFGSFAELERWCPTYTGTSIETKPPRMNRGERLHRRVYEKATNGQCLTLEQAHMAIASWFDEYVQRPQKGHLNGQAPIELFVKEKGPGIEKAELNYLMMSLEIRTIGRNGIRFLGQNYYDPALYGRRHPIIIRYDLQDDSAVYIFKKTGEFICEARPVEKVHPAANILGTDEDREKLKEHIAFKRSQERDASIFARKFLEDEVMPEHRRMMDRLGISGAGAENVKQLPEKPTKINEAKILADVKELEAMQPVKEETAEVETLPEVVDETAEIFSRLSGMNEMDRYEKLLELEIRRLLIPKQYQAFMTYYEVTPEYEKYQDYFEEHRAKTAMMYQTDIAEDG